MALPTMAAPTRPAPIPQCSGLACAWVVDATVPVMARVASASAANLVLIDMEVSILCCAAIVVRMPCWTEVVGERFDKVPRKYGFVVYFFDISDGYENKSRLYALRRNNSGSNLSTSS